MSADLTAPAGPDRAPGLGRRGRLPALAALLAAVLLTVIAPALAHAERMERSLRVGGAERSYVVHMPRSGGGPHPVIVAYHPGGATSKYMEDNAAFHRASGAENFVVVYPEGFRRTFNAGVCCGAAVARGVDDVAFFQAILADLATFVPIRQKAYVTGFSNGAMMNFRLICEVPQLIAAAAPFAGSAPMDNCVSGHPVPVLYMNGSEDRGALEGGERDVKSRFDSTSDILTNPREALAAIARRNSCGGSMAGDLTIDAIDSTCEAFQGCPRSAPVRFCVIPDLGHAWPGAPEPRGRLRQRIADERFGPFRSDLNGTGTVVWFFRQY